MTTWAATAIRAAHPDAFLAWAVDSRCAPVLDRGNLCDLVLEFPRGKWKHARWSPATWKEQLARYTRLRKENFDFGIDLQAHTKTALCLRLAQPKRRLSIAAVDPFARLLNPCLESIPDGVHTIRWNHEAICHFGDFQMPSHPISPSFPARDPLLATISVGAGHPTKEYPSENWATVARGLMRQGYQVAFLGGQLDSPIRVEGARDLVGRLPLEQTMAMVARSGVHLCADTGTGHMAAAYRVPVVSIFGPTDPSRFRPYTCEGIVLRKGDLTQNVSPDEVLAAATHLSRSERAVSHP